MKEGNFEGVEGVKIFTREWQPAGEPRGVVVISHGLNAHSGLYEWAAQQFTASGLAVYALDHRGRGRSEAIAEPVRLGGGSALVVNPSP